MSLSITMRDLFVMTGSHWGSPHLLLIQSSGAQMVSAGEEHHSPIHLQIPGGGGGEVEGEMNKVHI